MPKNAPNVLAAREEGLKVAFEMQYYAITNAMLIAIWNEWSFDM